MLIASKENSKFFKRYKKTLFESSRTTKLKEKKIKKDIKYDSNCYWDINHISPFMEGS